MLTIDGRIKKRAKTRAGKALSGLFIPLDALQIRLRQVKELAHDG